MSSPHITQLRQQLLDTLADLRSRDNPMEPDRARAIAQVAGVLVDTAKVEVDYLKVTGQDRAGFLEEPVDPAVAHLGHTPGEPVECPICNGTKRVDTSGMVTHQLGTDRMHFTEECEHCCGTGHVWPSDAIHCSTCNGEGTIDETLGGEHFSNPRARCPDCDGMGEVYSKSTAPARDERGSAEPDGLFGTFIERTDGTTEFRRCGEAHSPTPMGFKVWVLYTHPDSAQPPTVEQSIALLVSALAESKGWMRGYAESIIRDAIDRTDSAQTRDAAQAVELTDDQCAEIAKTLTRHYGAPLLSCREIRAVIDESDIARAVLAKNGLGGKQ